MLDHDKTMLDGSIKNGEFHRKLKLKALDCLLLTQH